MNSVHLCKVSTLNSNSNLTKQSVTTTPNSRLTKTKNKENLTKKKTNNTNSQNVITASAKNSKLTENSTSSDFILKRKYDQIESLYHQEEILAQTRYLIYKIDELFEKFSSRIFGREWKDEFMFELKQENIVDTSEILPKSLNTRGSHLLEYTKFWILLIEYKFSELDLLETLIIFNNAILYDQNDFQLLYEYLVRTLEENFEKKEIFSLLEKKNGQNHFRVPEKLEDLTREHYRFLLDKPEVFKDLKTMKSQYTHTPISNKAQILLNEIIHLNSNSKRAGCHSSSNHKLNSLSKSRITPASSSKCDIQDKQEDSRPLEDSVKLQDINRNNTHLIEKIASPEGVKSFDFASSMMSKLIVNESSMTYSELVQRNKLELVVEITSKIDCIQGIVEPENKSNETNNVCYNHLDHGVSFDLSEKKLSINKEANSTNERVIKSGFKYHDGMDENNSNGKSEVNLKLNQNIHVSKDPQNKKKKNNYKKKKKKYFNAP